MAQAYDIIGDIHGYATQLERVLQRLGYERQGEIYVPPEGRRAIFMGDFIDRGPQQRRVIEIARGMIDEGFAQAVMGNHEFNAVCYALPGQKKGGYIRGHTPNNLLHHEAFLEEFPFGSDEHLDLIDWFKTLPVYLDLPELQAVHACWHEESLKNVHPYLNTDGSLTQAGYEAYDREEEPFYTAIENLLKGVFQSLPHGVSYKDILGIERRKSRIYWWEPESLPTYEKLDLNGSSLRDEEIRRINGISVQQDFSAAANPEKPTFVGHYQLRGAPKLLAPKIVGVDYRGYVTAYKLGEDAEMSNEYFVFEN